MLNYVINLVINWKICISSEAQILGDADSTSQRFKRDNAQILLQETLDDIQKIGETNFCTWAV